jgi:hypothetical protein
VQQVKEGFRRGSQGIGCVVLADAGPIGTGKQGWWKSLGGPLREVYIGYWDAIGDGEPACEITFPYVD